MSITVHETTFGPLTLSASDAGLTRVRFGSAEVGDGAGNPILDQARREIDEYLAGERERFTVPVDLDRVQGEHRTILDALSDVPFGETTTYGALAARLGLDRDGARRVGGAMARNPVLIVVPCHRVLGVDGRLVGYAGGTLVKRALLDLEARDRAGQAVLC
ncbi:methylated-DNA--[protein]-cysteine S-methyltransferase [Pseudonocardia endophytica]|uniref:Methylated-DNA-[protein]-cysteine S-methyltransferase n=1 Tax=Pseudonocardia endophytica TaxID=401976 RepID=A0A4R1HE44_PSEEN|nr:methylated-DNA--[protein]-cysteine S-methyltransferase [Pseudonocardia endophytica]TCK19848.1 methylated-DNA-[protein]-cysteine S-methyltransferase [Pseudonocardia endophytica]